MAAPADNRDLRLGYLELLGRGPCMEAGGGGGGAIAAGGGDIGAAAGIAPVDFLWLTARWRCTTFLWVTTRWRCTAFFFAERWYTGLLGATYGSSGAITGGGGAAAIGGGGGGGGALEQAASTATMPANMTGRIIWTTNFLPKV